MDKKIFSSLDDRKKSVLRHFEKTLGVSVEKATYFQTEELLTDLFTVDVVCFEPTDECEYFVVSTVGLSEFQFDKNFARNEIFLVLSKNWKKNFSKEESAWPLRLLHEIAYLAVDEKKAIYLNKVYQVAEKEFSFVSDAVGGIVVLPEMFDNDVVEEKIGSDYTRFFQVVPVSEMQIMKIEDFGVDSFVRFDLHDTEGPVMTVEFKPAGETTLGKIISHNERSLKGL